MMHHTIDEPVPDTEAADEPVLRRIAEQAAEWIDRLEDADEKERCLFADWLTKSPCHIEEFLRMCALNHELRKLGERGMISKVDPVTPARDEPVIFLHSSGQGKTALVADFLPPPRDEASADQQMYVKYRRPLLQTFLHRRIPRDAAEDLLQRTFLQAIKKIRTEGLDDASNLGGYLYRTACKLATAYWRGELSRRHDSDHELLSNLKDEALSLEERLDHEQLAACVRDLIGHLPVQRDREVLMRYYLAEESRTAIRESLQLTDMQFNQVTWRARQRLAAILRKRGFAAGEALTTSTSLRDAAKSREHSMTNLFISYDHRDRSVLDRLHAHLGNLREEGSITTWIDRDISAGTSSGREITSQLEASRLFVPLVSADFLNSRYCYDMEMTKAIRLHESGKIKVVPVILEDCDWLSSPLRQFETLPGNGKPIEAWGNDRAAYFEIASGLRRLAQSA